MYAGEIDLLPGERVLWAGEPVHRPILAKGDVFTVPIGLLLAAAGFVLLGQHRTDQLSMILVVVLLVLGVYAALARPFLRYLALGKTTYAITDSRVITTSGLFRTRERSDDLAGLGTPTVRPGRSATGTIAFSECSATLMGIGQPARVRDQLVKAIEEARRRVAPTPEAVAPEPAVPEQAAPEVPTPEVVTPEKDAPAET